MESNKLQTMGNILSLIKADEATQEATKTILKNSYVSEVDDKAFRWCKPTKSTSLQWYQPDQGKDDMIIEEIPGGFNALRGYIISMHSGFTLFPDSTEELDTGDADAKKGGNAPLCRTTSALVRLGGRITQSELPFWYPAAYGPDKFGDIDPALDSFEPMGSSGSLCKDCVLAGRHVSGKSRCGLRTRIIFVVTELAKVKADFANKKETLVWKKVTDYKDDEGKQVFDKPFVLRMDMSAKSAIRISNGIKLKGLQSNGGYIPDDATSLAKFAETAIRNQLNYAIEPIDNLPLEFIWTMETEMYLTTGTNPNNAKVNIQAYPLFRIAKPLPIEEMEPALGVYMMERAAYCEANGITKETRFVEKRPAPIAPLPAAETPNKALTGNGFSNGNGNGNGNGQSIATIEAASISIESSSTAPADVFKRVDYQ